MPDAINLVGVTRTKNASWFALAGHRHSWLKDAPQYAGGLGVGQTKLDIYKSIECDGSGALPALDPHRLGTTTQVAGLTQKLQTRSGGICRRTRPQHAKAAASLGWLFP